MSASAAPAAGALSLDDIVPVLDVGSVAVLSAGLALAGAIGVGVVVP
jgi:hypothetical protein